MLTVSIALCVVAAVTATRDYRNIGISRAYLERSMPRTIENGWKLTGKPHPKDEHEFTIALASRNVEKMEPLLYSLSDPKSDKYGQYLTLSEVADLFGADTETIEKVKAWTEDSGARVTRVSEGRNYVTVRATTTAAEAMFETEFHLFEHDVAPGQPMVRALAPYSAPIDLADFVDYVSGVHGLPKMKDTASYTIQPHLEKRQNNPLIGPVQLRQRYNVTVMGGAAKQNSQAVAEFQSQYYAPSDLKTFFSKYVPYSKNDTVAGVRPPTSNNPNAPGVEAQLDIQYIMGVAANVPTYFYASATFDFWAGLTAWANLLDSEKNPPYVHSVSYGDQASSSKPSKSYQDNMDQTFMKLGMRGISIIFASGDSGNGCTFCIFLEPSFPATSPHVTSVGATRFINGKVGPEMAVERFHSGGGFSWDYPRPAYQDAAVKHFLTTQKANLPFSFEYNAAGRATPDVAALGIGFAVENGGTTIEVGGTSAAAPTFAAITSLLNEVRFTGNKPPMGFLNPWIYQVFASHPTAFYDITQGNGQDGCCFTGFKAAPGYEPLCGVGTPNFAVLKTLI